MILARLRRTAARYPGVVAFTTSVGLLLATLWWYGEVPAYRSTVVVRLLEADAEQAASEALLLRSDEVVGGVVDRLALRLRWNGGSIPDAVSHTEVGAGVAERWSGELRFDSAGVSLADPRGGRSPARARYGSVLRLPAVSIALSRAPRARRARLDVIPRDEAVAALSEALRIEMTAGESDIVLSVGSNDAEAGARRALALAEAFETARAERIHARAAAERRILAAAADRSDETLATLRAASLLEEAQTVAAVDVIRMTPTSVARPPWGLLVLLGGALAGGLVGIVAMIGYEVSGGALTRVEDVERELEVPALGVIPRIHTHFRRGRTKWRPAIPRRSETIASPATRAGAEAFRALRTHLTLATGDLPHSILLTSAGPEEGTTMSVMHLGLAFADQGLETLIVDADLRRPRLAKHFRFPETPGLTDVLTGSVHATRAIRHTPFERLDLLPAGTPLDRHLELLGGEGLPRFLHDMHARYHVVLLDSPPALTSADALVVGAAVEGVVVVLRAGRADGEAGRTVLRQLRQVGASVLGVVLNDPDRHEPRPAKPRPDVAGEGAA